MNNELTLEKLIAFCKTRGFIYPSSEIYGGFAAVYDYGHYGYLLKENIKNEWMKFMIQEHSNIFALDSGIFMHPKTWVASGHVDSFDDPQVDCKNCKNRFRADHLLEEFGVEIDDKSPIEELNAQLDALRHEGKLQCPICKSKDLTGARKFSLMVKSNMGSPTDQLSDDTVVYMRAETCQGIYLNYKNVIESIHPKIPFGVAQVGKAFRNEIVARQFIFRTREFEQMELQYFINKESTEEVFEEWHQARWNWYLNLGIKEDNLKWHKHEKLAHYASAAYDIEFKFRSLGGFKEVEGVHARGDWDLSQHAKFSGEKLDYFDQEKNERFVPHIVETSVGLNRSLLMFLDQAYTEEVVKDETRIVLKLDKRLAPVKVAIFPLTKKPELTDVAKSIYHDLRKHFMCEYEEKQSIGKRYRRQDEVGTPYCLTIDFDTLEDNSVTVRERDSMEQRRVKIDELKEMFVKEFVG
jgi:glycyl-tRNA synthetase